jgi:hypothetical protein
MLNIDEKSLILTVNISNEKYSNQKNQSFVDRFCSLSYFFPRMQQFPNICVFKCQFGSSKQNI